MARDKDTSNKSKRITAGEGTSSRRKTTHQPEHQPLAIIPATAQASSPFENRMKMTPLMKEREAKLKQFKVLNPLYPDMDLLSNLNILDSVESHFRANGFGFVFDLDPPLVYEALLREFIYSFVPTWDVVPRHKSRYPTEVRYAKEWKFRLGGIEYTYHRKDLIRALKLCDRDNFPYISMESLDTFWGIISGTEEEFIPAQQSTKIILPEWRLVHRFIATCVIQRKDEGRWVTKGDLELMCCIHKRKSFDPLITITKYLEDFSAPRVRGTYLGGGAFVTLLAEDIGIPLDQKFAMPRKLLGESEMIRRGFLKLERNRSGIHRLLVGRDIFTQSQPTQPQQPATTETPPAAAEPSPSPPRATQNQVTMETLSAQIRDLQNYTHEGFLWVNDMFADLSCRMGYEAFPPHPPHPHGTVHSDAPTGTDEANPEYATSGQDGSSGNEDMDETGSDSENS